MKLFAKLGALLAGLLLLAACSNAPETAADGNLNAGAPAPTFELADLDGDVHSLADYEGEKVYIKYWASWCTICLSGMDELNRLAGQDTDFKVLTIVSPGAKGEKGTEAFKKWYSGLENTENIEVLLDEGGEIAEAYGIIGFPTSAFIGSDGVLVKTAAGHKSNDLIKEEFDAIY
ncbi:TlpA family protein disulfide reductase [Indiicoccus explosivorum]|uniref:TlpA family protein disulfide reductase n=1 Tax=Indiicoccus explosivorum TaxID=1917864 RepID=UPI000B43C854|nr:redoxin family protein [Indiicoccus explosivorum]